jgi:hypothetical protein
MLNTPVMQLRKQAPGSLTTAKVAECLRKNRLPCSRDTVGDFERGEYRSPPDRFLELYAECIGQSPKAVEAAWRKTRLMREKKTGPFRE